MTEKMTITIAKIKNKYCKNMKRTIALVSVRLCYSFVERIFKMKLNTFVTKDKDTLTFKYAHSINP